jgi:hypothetical protein
MKKSIFGILATVSFAFAGSTSTSVPVTISYAGGCKINNLQANYNIGAVPTIMSGDGIAAIPVTFDLMCTSGTSFTVKPTNYDYNLVRANGTGGRYLVDLYKDAGLTQKITTTMGVESSGTGATESMVFYTKVAPSGDCTSIGSNKFTCEPGTLTTALNLTIAW